MSRRFIRCMTPGWSIHAQTGSPICFDHLSTLQEQHGLASSQLHLVTIIYTLKAWNYNRSDTFNVIRAF